MVTENTNPTAPLLSDRPPQHDLSICNVGDAGLNDSLVLEGRVPLLNSETYEKARAVAPGWDVRHLEKEWRDWIVEAPRDADAAFIGFYRKCFEKRGHPS